MVPALLELFHPSDLLPLKVVDRSAGDVDFFAKSFRKYVDRQMAGASAEGTFPDGTRVLRVRAASDVSPGVEERLVLVDAPVTLGGGETFLAELYAQAPLTGGPGAVYRAAYAEQDLTLGEGSQVLRWVHAVGELRAGAGSVLAGRVSSERSVSLAGKVSFERIAAPVISAGPVARPLAAQESTPVPFSLPAGAVQVGDHFQVEGDLEIPEGALVAHSLVVRGVLRVGARAVVEGSIKAHGDIVLGDGAVVRGSVVGRCSVTTGAAWIGGPVIGEDRILLGANAVVGGPELPATVNAPVVEMMFRATVYGQINAPRGGRTLVE